MTVAALTPPAIPAFRMPFGKINLDLDEFGFDELPKCAQRLIIFLYEATNFAKDPIRFTDAQIAEKCNRSRSWVQKALAAICDRIVETADGEKLEAPIARRYRLYGTREKAGRVIELIADWLKPKPKPAGLAGSTTRSKAKATVPGPAPIATATAAVARDPEPEPNDPAALERLKEVIAGAKTDRTPDRRRLSASVDAARAEREAAQKRRDGLAARIASTRAILEHGADPVALAELGRLERALAELDARDQAPHPARE